MTKDWKALIDMLLQLFWVFFRIGPSTFGGGYAMIPTIEREVVEKKRWISETELSDLVALAGSAPGGVGVNAAAFVGYRKAGIAGASVAVFGVTCPTFIIVIALSLFYMLFNDNPKLEAALKGIHGAVVALIFLAAYRMAKTSIFDATTAALSVSALGVLLTLHLNPIYVIVLGVFLGIVLIKGKKMLGMRANTEPLAVSGAESKLVYPEYYI